MWIVDMSVKSATMTTHTTRAEDKSLDGRTVGWIGHLGRSGFSSGPRCRAHGQAGMEEED